VEFFFSSFRYFFPQVHGNLRGEFLQLGGNFLFLFFLAASSIEKAGFSWSRLRRTLLSSCGTTHLALLTSAGERRGRRTFYFRLTPDVPLTHEQPPPPGLPLLFNLTFLSICYLALLNTSLRGVFVFRLLFSFFYFLATGLTLSSGSPLVTSELRTFTPPVPQRLFCESGF